MTNVAPIRRSPSNRIAALASMAAAIVAGVGCSGARVSFTPEGPTTVIRSSTRTAESVEVLLDETPKRSHEVVGELRAASVSNTSSINAMRAAAARAGLDGIFWIDCTSSCSGRCRAKGFVYADTAGKLARR